jgi:hypothetical protein
MTLFVFIAAIFFAASTGFIFGWAMGSRMAKANYEALDDRDHAWGDSPGDPVLPRHRRRPF